MKKVRLFTLLLAGYFSVCSSMALAQDTAVNGAKSLTVFLTRHAEKLTSGRDPELSEAGKLRAQQLSNVLSDAKLDRIYSTDFFRTRQTATPVAEQYEKAVEIYDYKQLKQLAETLKQQGGRYLIVGHSNTTPHMVKLLGGDAGAEINEKKEFDRLYMLNIDASGNVSTVLLRYGKAFSKS